MNTWGRIFLGVLIIITAVLIGLLILIRSGIIDAVIALLGVLVGGAISGFVQYWVTDADRKQQLRLAGLEKRLQAAQEAYALWHQLRRLGHPDKDPNLDKVLEHCQEWWESNSLYLTAEARVAFRDAYRAAEQLAVERSRRASVEEMIDYVNIIHKAGGVIEASVFLPSVGELDSRRSEHP